MTEQELEGLRLVELMDLLHDVPVPPRVPMWPQTWGWAVVAVIVLAVLRWAVRTLRARHAANAYRRAALTELAQAGDDPAAIAAILRRTALVAFPRADVAGLTGSDWLEFLNEQVPGCGFTDTLTSAPYRPTTPDPALAKSAQIWIRQHRRAT